MTGLGTGDGVSAVWLHPAANNASDYQQNTDPRSRRRRGQKLHSSSSASWRCVYPHSGYLVRFKSIAGTRRQILRPDEPTNMCGLIGRIGTFQWVRAEKTEQALPPSARRRNPAPPPRIREWAKAAAGFDYVTIPMNRLRRAAVS